MNRSEHVELLRRIARLRASPARRGLAIMYHRIAPVAGDPRREFSPALAADDFAAQLRHLRRHWRIVSTHDLVQAVARRRRGARFPVALTFDDDTSCHLDVALPLLRKARAPATFFLNGHALDAPRAYWWERVQAAHDAGHAWSDILSAGVWDWVRSAGGSTEPPAWEISLVIEELSSDERREISERARDLLGGDPPFTGLSRARVQELAQAKRVTIGWHGHSHEPMSFVDPPTLDRELDVGRDALAAAAGEPLDAIAYPHGKVNADVVAAVRHRGFATGFTVEPRAIRPGDDPLLLGRVDGAQASLDAFTDAIMTAISTSLP